MNPSTPTLGGNEFAGAIPGLAALVPKLEDNAAQGAPDAPSTEAQRQFMANISHEVRTPLNGVIGMLDLLGGTELSPKQQHYVRMARVSADSLLNLINEVLDFSEMQSGKLNLEFSDFDIHQLLEDVADMFIQRFEAKGLELTVHIHSSVPQTVTGDPERLRQILINLVSNAVKFTERGEVVIRASVQRDASHEAVVRFSVNDTGVGIPRDRMDRLFKSFSQVDSSATRRYGGMGLGLAVCKHLIERLGGTIEVESEVGKGSNFHFTVPLKKAADPRPLQSPPESLSGLRILAVDDNVTNLEILQSQLTNWKYDVVLADSGRRALELLTDAAQAGHPFDMAILDMQMPEMDGLELAAEIKRRDAISDTLLVMLTSTGESMSRERMIARGLQGYLSKPVRQSRLFDAILTAAAGRPRKGTSAPAGSSSTAAPKFPNARILLAEDNEINQMVASEVLFRAGYRCDIVATGRAALEAVVDREYDLVLMDCQMPDLDGFEATRAIREHERDQASGKDGRRIPIVALTANAAKGDREHCLASGMDAYVTKPIEPSQLIGTIDALLESSHKSPEPSEPCETERECPFHLESLLHRCLGDKTFCSTILSKFTTRIDGQLTAVETAVTNSNATDLALHAHTLKGVAANLSADELRGCAAELERLARTGELGSIGSAVKKLRSEAERCRAAVAPLVAQLAAQ